MINKLNEINLDYVKLTGAILVLRNTEEISILDLAYKIRKKIDPNLKINFLTCQEDDPQRRLPDISFAKNKLDWTPKISLEQGLDLTINWFKEKLT